MKTRESYPISPEAAYLPADYARFNSRKEKVASLRYSDGFVTAYDRAYTLLCMTIDRPQQQGFFKDLKKNEIDKHEAVTQYQQALAESSSYRLLLQQSEQLKANPIRVNRREVEGNVIAKGLGLGTARIKRTEAWRNLLISHGLSGEHERYIEGLSLLASARSLSLEPIIAEIDQFQLINSGKLKVTVADWDVYLGRRLRSVIERADPYFKYAGELAGQVQKREEQLFGEDKEMASNLWKAVVYLRTANAPSKHIKPIRDTLVTTLASKDYAQTKRDIEYLEAIHPGLFTPITIRELDLNPTKIQKLIEEEKERIRQGILEGNYRASEEAIREREDLGKSLFTQYGGKKLISPDGLMDLAITGYFSDSTSVLSVQSNTIGGSTSRNINRLSSAKVAALIETYNLKPQV